MKKFSIIFLALFALLLSSCSGFREVEVTSCKVKSVVPKGLTGIQVNLEVGILNPAPSFYITDLEGTAKLRGLPCLTFEAEPFKVEGHTNDSYRIAVVGHVDKNFSVFDLAGIIADVSRLNDVTVDVRGRAKLDGGLSKKIGMKDVPLREVLNKF